jgi:PPOX class probable FMN-dependent enzyme
MDFITAAELDQLYRAPHAMVQDKVLDHVDRHGRTFLAHAPFCVIAAAGPDGALDVSPRGGTPGFVHVSEDGQGLILPDRRGNNRLDTIRNLLTGSGQIGMMFMIPGFEDIYRVNGVVRATADPELLKRFVEFQKPPLLALVVEVQEAFFHCPKAVMRAKLWDADSRVDRTIMPTGSEIFFDQLGLGAPTATESEIRETLTRQL